jgi:hypothetical protein
VFEASIILLVTGLVQALRPTVEKNFASGHIPLARPFLRLLVRLDEPDRGEAD